MKYEFEYKFLYDLLDKLEKYVRVQYDGNSTLTEWLDAQQLATREGWCVFEKHCFENNREDFIESEKKMEWDEFDEFVFVISKQLSFMNKNRR